LRFATHVDGAVGGGRHNRRDQRVPTSIANDDRDPSVTYATRLSWLRSMPTTYP
jgi:hypothetical protein